MDYDNRTEIDSPLYADAEHQTGNELLVYMRNGKGYWVINGVSKRAFLQLQKNPSHEALLALAKSLPCRFYPTH